MNILLLLSEDEDIAGLIHGSDFRGYSLIHIPAGNEEAAVAGILTREEGVVAILVHYREASVGRLVRIADMARIHGIPVGALITDDSLDHVTALHAGADFGIPLPVTNRSLHATLIAYRRIFDFGGKQVTSHPPVTSATFRTDSLENVDFVMFGNLLIDRRERKFYYNGEPVPIRDREYQLMDLFMQYPNQVVERAFIMEHVWGYRFDPATNVLDVHIHRLRSQLRNAGLPDMPETVRNRGFRLDVNELLDEPALVG
jgi:DNA-binding response OmpR family regulator